MAEFVVIDRRSAYNAIFGRPVIHSLRAVPSTLHQALKYSTPNGVGIVRGEQRMSRECYASALKGLSVCALEEQAGWDKSLESKADLPQVGKREFFATTEELELVPLLSPERQVSIGTKLGATDREEFINFLRTNSNVFAWSHENMPGIDPKIMAEYEALLAGLRVAKGLRAVHIKVFSDSQLVVNQIREKYQAKDSRMEKYLTKVRSHLAQLKTYEVNQVPRSENSNADALAKLASAYETDLARSVPVEILDNPSILEPDLMEVDTPTPSWMDLIVEFIKGNLPQDPKEHKKMARKVAQFILRDGALYRQGFSLPLLKCVTPEDGNYIIREIHEGVCGNHSGARHYPSASRAAHPYLGPMAIRTMGGGYHRSFFSWQRANQFAGVTVDYFTKWAEAEALFHITETRVTSFIWTDIVCRFGIPNAIVTDNGKQFDNAKFKDFCRRLGISHLSSSPAHPKANGQVEAINKIIKRGLKMRLDSRKGRWAEELPEVLWSYRTTPRESTGETQFSLTFDSEAVVPVEIGMPTDRVEQYEPTRNEEELLLDLDLLEEKGRWLSYD
ncbi:uncharacterized protein LOC111017809 [Momordica charantia]|uniref:Uncharacterized protein LOC111017809 n=1 Tax=Momordica charantia TaxID=3673 RepID=A0A6J1D6M1_MOMCH|nr:uncharacterized protein LOC111017809 [Momordica charantia]